MVAIPEIVGYLSIMTHWALISCQFATMHTVSYNMYEFVMNPEESAECHQTLSLQVGSERETMSS